MVVGFGSAMFHMTMRRSMQVRVWCVHTDTVSHDIWCLRTSIPLGDVLIDVGRVAHAIWQHMSGLHRADGP